MHVVDVLARRLNGKLNTLGEGLRKRTREGRRNARSCLELERHAPAREARRSTQGSHSSASSLHAVVTALFAAVVTGAGETQREC